MEHPVTEKWQEILEFIKNEYNITKVSFNTWISNLVVSKEEDGVVYLSFNYDDDESLDSNINYINNKYGKFIKTAIEEITNIKYEISFVTSRENSNSAAQVKNKKTDSTNSGLPLNPDYTFDNFVVSKNNRFAHATALKVAEEPGLIYNPLFIYGDSGLGKTHLMQSIGHFILENNSNKNVLYVTSDTFTNELISSLRQGNLAPAAFREKYRNIDVFLIDDIQFIIGKASTQEEFFYTFNALYEAKKQIVITSDKPPKDFSMLDERWKSRFTCGLIVDLVSPDYETKIAILQKKLDIKQNEGLDIDISNEVLSYIAENINSNIRTLEGALTKVIAYSKISRQPLTRENVEYALRDMLTPNQKKIITNEFIIDVVAEHYNINKEDILSKKRDQSTAVPRQIAMYLASEYTKNTVSAISKSFDKDHSTVSHNIEIIKKKIESDESFAKEIHVIINKLNPDK